MTRIVQRYRWWLLRVGLLTGLTAISAWVGSRWLASDFGSSEDVFKRVRIGMTQNEAVAVLRTYNPYTVEGLYWSGTTTDGRLFHSPCWFEVPYFDDLPPPQEIENSVLGIVANDGRHVEVILGPGGTVSGKGLTPGVWEYRLDQVHGALSRARTDLLSGLWWENQLSKANRSLNRRWHYILPGLAAGLLLASAWTVRRRIARRGPIPIQRTEPSRAKSGEGVISKL
jgi:hypothetical protein